MRKLCKWKVESLTIRNHLKSKLQVTGICVHRTAACSFALTLFMKRALFGFQLSELADSETDCQAEWM